MFEVYNQRIRYMELVRDDTTSSNDTRRQQLFYVLASDFELYDWYGLVYEVRIHDISPDFERFFREQYGPLRKPAIRAMLRRSLHIYDPARFKDISDADLYAVTDSEQASVMKDALEIYAGKQRGDVESVSRDYYKEVL